MEADAPSTPLQRQSGTVACQLMPVHSSRLLRNINTLSDGSFSLSNAGLNIVKTANGGKRRDSKGWRERKRKMEAQRGRKECVREKEREREAEGNRVMEGERDGSHSEREMETERKRGGWNERKEGRGM